MVQTAVAAVSVFLQRSACGPAACRGMTLPACLLLCFERRMETCVTEAEPPNRSVAQLAVLVRDPRGSQRSYALTMRPEVVIASMDRSDPSYRSIRVYGSATSGACLV